MNQDYDEFVKQKRRAEVATGHNPGALNEHLFDFQHAIVSWAVRRGRAAVFADTGLGNRRNRAGAGTFGRVRADH